MNTKLNHGQNWLELAKQANWSVKRVAELCHVSVRALELHFRKTMHKTPKTWMTEQRQKQALELLCDGASVKETAAKLGYKHSHHLSREFKRLQGCCPTHTFPPAPKLRALV